MALRILFAFVAISLSLVACGYEASVPANPYAPTPALSSVVAMSSTPRRSSTAVNTRSQATTGSSITGASSGATATSSASTGSFATGYLDVTYTPVGVVSQKYYPKNVNATWISNASGNWVANMVAHGRLRAKYLYNWRSDYTATIVVGVDGVASATVSGFSPFIGSWDAYGMPFGAYTLNMEFTSWDGQGPYSAVTFQLGSVPFDTTVQFSNFQNVHLVYTP